MTIEDRTDEGIARLQAERERAYAALAAAELALWRAELGRHGTGATSTHWLYGGPEVPRRAAQDTVRLAGYMANGEVKGYLLAFLRNDGISETKAGGELRWLPRVLRSVIHRVDDKPRIDAEIATHFAEHGLVVPPTDENAPLARRQIDRLAEELHRVLKLIGR